MDDIKESGHDRLFEVGSLVRIRIEDQQPYVDMWHHHAAVLPRWDVPKHRVEIPEIAIVLEQSGASYRILTASGSVGWVGAWDLMVI